MAWFTVQYRGADGKTESVQIESADRAGVFAELKKRGISAVRVEETKGKPRLVSRRSSSTGKGRSHSTAKCVVCGVVIACAAVAAWFILLPKPKEVHDKGAPKTVKKAEAVTYRPAIKPKPAQIVDPVEAQKEKWKQMGYPQNPWGHPIPKELEYKPHWKYTSEDYSLIDPGYKARHETFLAEQATIPWQHSCEIEIAQTLFAKPEDVLLFTPLSKNFKEQFLKSLENPIVITKDDSEEVAQQKREMREVKKYLKEQLDNGQDIVAIINEARESMSRLNGLRQTLLAELRELEKSASSEQEIDDYVEAANMMLKEKGAGSIKLPISATRLRLRAKERAEKMK